MKFSYFQTIISKIFENFDEKSVILTILLPFSPSAPQINADSAEKFDLTLPSKSLDNN